MAYSTQFSTNDWNTYWSALDGENIFHRMTLICSPGTGLYSGGDGGWYSHAALTSCSLYSIRSGAGYLALDANVSVRAYNAVYYPASDPHGGWGVIIDWNGNTSGSRDIWHSCGFQDGAGGSLWYTFG